MINSEDKLKAIKEGYVPIFKDGYCWDVEGIITKCFCLAETLTNNSKYPFIAVIKKDNDDNELEKFKYFSEEKPADTTHIIGEYAYFWDDKEDVYNKNVYYSVLKSVYKESTYPYMSVSDNGYKYCTHKNPYI